MKWFLSHSLSPRNKLVGGELTINSLILPSKVTKIIISDTSLQVKRPTFITCLYYLSLCKLIHIAHIYTYLSTRTTVFVCLKITQIEVHNSLFEVFFSLCVSFDKLRFDSFVKRLICWAENVDNLCLMILTFRLAEISCSNG